MLGTESVVQHIRCILAQARQLRRQARQVRWQAQRMRWEAIQVQQHAIQARHHARLAALQREMPAANPLTRAMAADILAARGLLDRRLASPAHRDSADVRGKPAQALDMEALAALRRQAVWGCTRAQRLRCEAEQLRKAQRLSRPSRRLAAPARDRVESVHRQAAGDLYAAPWQDGWEGAGGDGVMPIRAPHQTPQRPSLKSGHRAAGLSGPTPRSPS